ncbi:hypothetical protein Plhal304r1_c070g0158701 [Plasmopara halstedii]
MQRNEVEAVLTSIGLGSPDVWHSLSQELAGKTHFEQPRVPKKVLVRALRLQTEAIRYLVTEFDRVHDQMANMEHKARETLQLVKQVDSKLLTVENHVEDVNTKVEHLEYVHSNQVQQVEGFDSVAVEIRATREEVQNVVAKVETFHALHNDFVEQTTEKLSGMKEEHEMTKQFFEMKVKDRSNEEERELFVTSDHILHHNMSLANWIEAFEKENHRKDVALRECTDKMTKQGRNVHDMMLETRQKLNDNLCAVEDVQRVLLDKADRIRMEKIIETKYEEMCSQLDKALTNVLEEEEEYKRVSQELQQLVTHLSESKADKQDLLEVKEQVLYDSRVRQQVENLRSFIDLKMNRDDVFSALKSKADKDEILALLKNLSESMNASILQAQKSLKLPDSAIFTGKQTGYHGGREGNNRQKRTEMLPCLNREKCLSCNSQLRDLSTTSNGPISNKNPFQLASVYGGGFHLPIGTGSVEKSAVRNRSNLNKNHYSASASYLSPRTVANMASNGQLVESASEEFLVGVDGRIYQADPEVVAQVKARSYSSFKLPQASGPRKAFPVYEESD